MRHRLTSALILSAALSACGGGDAGITEPPPPPPPAVLLKEISVPNLPAPYYHFEYDAAGQVTGASFASGFFVYAVRYDGGRLSEMSNDAVGNTDKLEYFYDNAGHVNRVTYVHPDGVVYVRISLTYDGQKLVGLQRERIFDSQFVVNKTISLSYSADGNLLELAEHFPAVAGIQPETNTVDHFDQYDDKINVDDFSLIHDEFFDHLVLLPGVRLQKGNPARVTRTGDGDNFVVDYTYAYDDANRPLTRSGELTFTTGTDTGRTFQVLSVFSYY